MRWLLPVGFVIIAAGVLAAVFVRSEPRPGTAADTASRTPISLTTSDGIRLSGDISYPTGANRVRAVILVHPIGRDRHDWDAMYRRFVDRRLAVLRYDTRGSGASPVAAKQDVAAFINSMPTDVAAAVDFLRRQPRVRSDRLSVIGADLGGNIAWLAAGMNFGLYRAVVISPNFAAGFLTGDGRSDFSPAGVLAVGAEQEQSAVDKVMAGAADPKDQLVVPAPDKHGVDLLARPGVFERVVQWIQ